MWRSARMLRIFVFFLAFLIASPIDTSGAQMAEALTVGFFLNQTADRVDHALGVARESGRSVVVEASVQADIVISRARAAYADSLDRTIGAVDAQMRLHLSQIETMVSALEEGAAEHIHRALAEAQTVSNTLPLASRFPQVSSAGPRLIAALDRPVRLLVVGNFPDASKRDYDPWIDVGGRRVPPSEITTGSLAFDIRPELFGLRSETHITVTPVMLTVPYPEHIVGIPVRRKAMFRLPMGVLPERPGSIVFYSVNRAEGSRRESHRGPGMSHNSFEGDRLYCATAPSGTSIIPESVRLLIDDEHGNSKYGDWNEYRGPSSGGQACWYIHADDDDVQIDFHLEFEAERLYREEQTNSEAIAVAWGQTFARSVPNTGNWRVVFTPFEGPAQEFVGPGSSEPPYLRVGVRNANVTMELRVPPEFVQ